MHHLSSMTIYRFLDFNKKEETFLQTLMVKLKKKII